MEEAASPEERECYHWFIPMPVIIRQDGHKSYVCDRCGKTDIRENFNFHLKTCCSEYCSEVIVFDRLDSNFHHERGFLFGSGDQYTRYCDHCYSLYYTIVGNYPYPTVCAHGRIALQRVWSKRARVPGFKTKSANKV